MRRDVRSFLRRRLCRLAAQQRLQLVHLAVGGVQLVHDLRHGGGLCLAKLVNLEKPTLFDVVRKAIKCAMPPSHLLNNVLVLLLNLVKRLDGLSDALARLRRA